VLEHGGDETEAIAALLQDAAEDQGGKARFSLMKRGERNVSQLSAVEGGRRGIAVDTGALRNA
jgi:hypothetical protein